jgi:hypothetical protein
MDHRPSTITSTEDFPMTRNEPRGVCPDCDDSGWIEVRHPEIDDVAPDGVAYLHEPCTCTTGTDWWIEQEQAGFDAQERGGAA